MGDRHIHRSNRPGSREPGLARLMRLVRPLLALALVTIVVTLLMGHAASLGGLVPRSLGAGATGVTACDTNGLTTSWTTSGTAVTGVTIGGLSDPGCEGQSLRVTVTDSTGTSLGAGGPAVVPTDGDTADNSVTVSLSPQPAASSVTNVHVAIVGT